MKRNQMNAMNYKTKKELQAEINRLSKELAEERMKSRDSAIIEAAALPKCKGLYCFHCIYAVYRFDRYGNGTTLLGCGKDAGCEHFTPAYSQEKIEACSSAQEVFQVNSKEQ